jgi:hypothetical protein
MQQLSIRLLRVFGELGKERLDLHTLLEAAGNDPAERRREMAGSPISRHCQYGRANPCRV